MSTLACAFQHCCDPRLLIWQWKTLLASSRTLFVPPLPAPAVIPSCSAWTLGGCQLHVQPSKWAGRVTSGKSAAHQKALKRQHIRLVLTALCCAVSAELSAWSQSGGAKVLTGSLRYAWFVDKVTSRKAPTFKTTRCQLPFTRHSQVSYLASGRPGELPYSTGWEVRFCRVLHVMSCQATTDTDRSVSAWRRTQHDGWTPA